ncbi:NUDIX hydrolase [Nonomuraea sp. H19]|uniref:NUDIX hydrolase n=1 Tax=Nonomuraea sp. H19 TaxID=3452206 RepID=UPI003F8B1033
MSAVVKTPDGRLLALGQGLPDNAQCHFLPGGVVDASTATFEDALRRILHEQFGIEVPSRSAHSHRPDGLWSWFAGLVNQPGAVGVRPF